MKKIGYLLLTFVFQYVGFAQVGMEQWRMHISPNTAIDVVKGKDAIYTILKNGLLEYDMEAGEQTIWTAANYLSDVSPSSIAYDPNTSNVIIGYENGNIDLLKNNTIYNLPAILQSSINGVKRINRIVVKQGFAYVSTGVGIVVVNLNKKEVKDTYNPSLTDRNIIDLAFFQDSVYALTSSAIYVSNENNNFLADANQWRKIQSVPDYTASGAYTEIEAFKNHLTFCYNDDNYSLDTLFTLENNIPVAQFDEIEINGVNADKNKLILSTAGSVLVYDENLALQENIYQYQSGGFPNPRNVEFYDGNYYIADGSWGLIKAPNAFSSTQINFEGPRYNSAFRASWEKGKLSIANGGLTSFGGPLFNQDGGAIFSEGKWNSVTVNGSNMIAGKNIWDFISTSINPKDTEVVAFGTLSTIPLVITKNNVVTDTFSFSNSLIEETSNVGWANISDIQYDDQGNLWVLNSNAEKPLKVYSNEGVWYDFNLSTSVKNKYTQRLIIDGNETKWMGVKGLGVVAFDHGESISDAGDDRSKILTTGPNSGALPSSTIEAIAADFDNNIWVGTPEGMRVLYNSSGVFDASAGQYNFQKLLIEFGEYVEIVLGTTHITAIQIDGANRKWIGTASSGVFLLSPDGLSVERNFTAENSPLLSNTILDIAIDQENGEVYFITEDGMISYRSDATQGDIEYTNVKVFPNPVQPDYLGPITIQGIAYDSDVKITDVSGKLVYRTKSNGGTATWNGNTLEGERAATGVYLIWTSVDDPEFKGRKVGKVVLINQSR
ncbi:hypothetical protein CW751_00845 [Brumimicrobium salinarum]|uniref:PorZ N-terminal beta-propeller domain-containing protein n=1 Tax=Brumimicrobium salinarum TaxID=2058658 RepID=A0A2I0R5S0_9FLAO|nr:hypothetical protein [Brumimicrobium salinarum]PKR81915.1 hypothetical protein CW751_00845 [Brumimicrobium salinarum]